MKQPNKQILQLFIEGDHNAADAVYRFYRKPVIRFAQSLLKDPVEAENVFQEVFTKIMAHRPKINPEMNFSSYFFTAVRNEIFDYFKKLKKDQHLKDEFWSRIELADRHEQLLKEERLQQLEEEIEHLSPKRKQVLQMNYFEKKSYQEIANELSISVNTVKNQLIKAKAHLRQELN
ncbi:DNA-directed RNA polymerase sigma-70 factor [Echinicola pacifica]|uniref:DNA-directed RNA polymerase sigma-70 factor n=1 Tax=Echinicola pacifica TaxID=346377 RepID=A0A918UT85_9BACT|nr:RNA polymerase sigma-70 factor [Echinicola pacifica]GGZ32254.1 DNA-directed RNA polymerase sigma-70 factor [Echinicola pacifica]